MYVINWNEMFMKHIANTYWKLFELQGKQGIMIPIGST